MPVERSAMLGAHEILQRVGEGGYVGARRT
jgi:hypothetical protein